MTDANDNLSSLFEAAFAAQDAGVAAWLKDFRAQSFARFRAQGLPSRKDERWRFSPLSLLREMSPTTNAAAAAPVPIPDFAKPLLTEGAARLVFVDGVFAPGLSNTISVDGLTVTPLSLRDATRAPEILDSRGCDADAFWDLNGAFTRDGALICVSGDVSVPIEIVFLTAANTPGAQHLVCPRNLITLKDNARATITECHVGLSASSFALSATAIKLGGGAQLKHARVSLESAESKAVTAAQVVLDRNALYEGFHFTTGAKFYRHNLQVALLGAGARTELNGLYAVKEQRHADHFVSIAHDVADTTSRQVYKGVVQSHGRSGFNGKIAIAKDAQRTNASQLNKNLLLGPHAEADAKPELEIAADDVKCSHGATVGRLSDEEVFYLESRGIPRAQALPMLVRGFTADVTERAPTTALKSGLNTLLSEAFFT